MQYVILRNRTACDFRRGSAIETSYEYALVCCLPIWTLQKYACDRGQQMKHIIPVLRKIWHRVFTAVNELLPDTCLCRSCFSGSEKFIDWGGMLTI